MNVDSGTQFRRNAAGRDARSPGYVPKEFAVGSVSGVRDATRRCACGAAAVRLSDSALWIVLGLFWRGTDGSSKCVQTPDDEILASWRNRRFRRLASTSSQRMKSWDTFRRCGTTSPNIQLSFSRLYLAYQSPALAHDAL